MIWYFLMEVECIGNTHIIHMEETRITQRIIGLKPSWNSVNMILDTFPCFKISRGVVSRNIHTHLTRLCHMIYCHGDKSYPCLVRIGLKVLSQYINAYVVLHTYLAVCTFLYAVPRCAYLARSKRS